jgi:hypothetical protein
MGLHCPWRPSGEEKVLGSQKAVQLDLLLQQAGMSALWQECGLGFGEILGKSLCFRHRRKASI